MKMRNLVLILLFSSSLSVFSFEFSAMTFNTQNLFDTLDDPKKNDKAYLPIELKQSEKHIYVLHFLEFPILSRLGRRPMAQPFFNLLREANFGNPE